MGVVQVGVPPPILIMSVPKQRLDAAGHEIPKCNCPICGYQPDCASAADNSDSRPKPGDITVCLKCGEIMEFGSRMELQEASLDTLKAIQQDPEQWWYLCRTQELIRQKRFIA